MRYKLLGHSGLRVSELCLGTMTFGDDWGWGGAYEESRKMFDAFAAAGGNFIDTANLYTNGTSEKFVGEFVKSDREKWVLATKYSLNMGNGGVNAAGNHRKNMVQAVEASLKRLDLEYIDLLWLHAWDYTTPVEEVMRSFDDLVRQGKVLYIGISDTPAWIISQANTIAQLRGWTPFIGLQIEYSLIERTPERDLLPMAHALEIGVTAWSPLGAGILTGKYNQGEPVEGRLSDPNTSRPVTEKQLAIAQTVVDIANEIGRLPAQVALNWIRHQSGGIIPIIGSRKLEQLQENIASLEFELTPEQLKKLDEVSAIELGFPHDFLKSDMVQNFAFGGVISQLDRRAR
ncbi:MAG: aldo/keto reductase [Plectolyngbya sp. WJT66-NPBG17]|nr:aldo/keto reductase [Plectolyngbya sp. WJT66-NPBG17]MBW4524225.1 aldo/keto reductase [Phormidium tanganyikae FI6-MK23]